MALLDDYEQQYSILTAEITSNIGRLQKAEQDDRRNLIVEINKGIDEAEELLEQIGLEIREESNPTTKSKLLSRVNCYFSELKRLKHEYNQAKITKTGFDDSDLNSEDLEIGMQEDQKRRLLDNSERLERTGNYLQDGYRVAIETESTATQVLQDLHQQREQINRSRGKLRETNAELGRSSRLMNSMLLRSMRDRFILTGVAAVFVIAVAFSIYYSVSN